MEEKILQRKIRERFVEVCKKKKFKFLPQDPASSQAPRPDSLPPRNGAPRLVKEEAKENIYIYLPWSHESSVTSLKSSFNKDCKEDKKINFFLPRSSEERSFTPARCGRLLEEGNKYPLSSLSLL